MVGEEEKGGGGASNSDYEVAVDGKDGEPSSYRVKWIGWQQQRAPGRRTAVVMQNENGPCPLLSIVNVLLLRGKMNLPPDCDRVAADWLLQHIGLVILESVPSGLSDCRRPDYDRNVNDAIAILPKLQTGLDVNVRFTAVSHFEYTSECIIFDLLDIPLYHGWLLDPQQEDVVRTVQSLTYNQLVDKIISQKNSSDSDKVAQSLIAQQFLEESASQLTYHGLCELTSTMKEGELAVFFRNNHFSAIYKERNELFLLVTDQGFLKEPRVAWETLSNIDGDGHFVDENFVNVKVANCDFDPNMNFTSEQQISCDHQLAVKLAEEDSDRYKREMEWEEYKNAKSSDGTPLTDEELAKKLQDEENAAAVAAQSQSSSAAPSRSGPAQHSVVASPNESRSRNCTIL